jgi:hypothetical protein
MTANETENHRRDARPPQGSHRPIRLITFQGAVFAATALVMSAVTFEAKAGTPPQSDVARTGEAILSQLLDDREAGKPVDCLSLHNVRSSRIIDRTAVIFDAGGTLYLNRPESGADLLANDKAIVTRSDSGQICSGEAVELFDATSGVQSGAVFLGRFVPYRAKQVQNPSDQGPSNGY